MRNSTERPETVSHGTNELIGSDPSNLANALNTLFDGKWKQGFIPPLWDGKTGERIVSLLEKLSSSGHFS
jgi:UDP-N-acetylglucosamine 2-epimerase (non-hydrolysing)